MRLPPVEIPFKIRCFLYIEMAPAFDFMCKYGFPVFEIIGFEVISVAFKYCGI